MGNFNKNRGFSQKVFDSGANRQYNDKTNKSFRENTAHIRQEGLDHEIDRDYSQGG